MSAFTQSLTLRTRTRRVDADGKPVYDDYGNDIFDETPATSDGWVVYPRNASELVQGQDTSIVGVTAVYVGAIVGAGAIDAVTIETGPYAASYEVDGLPGFYVHPVTGRQVTELHLTRITG